MSSIGREIKRLREKRDWSQAELAVYAGSSQPTVNQIENGKRNPSTATLEKLAGALGVEIADLFPKGQAPLPLEDGDTWQRGLNAGEASEPRHPPVHELREKVKEMRLVAQRRRDDIERMDSSKSAHELDWTRVREFQAFDHDLREEYGDFVDAINEGTEIESPEMRRLCLEFSGELAALENLSAQAQVATNKVSTQFSIDTEKTTHGIQEHLQGRGVEQEVKK